MVTQSLHTKEYNSSFSFVEKNITEITIYNYSTTDVIVFENEGIKRNIPVANTADVPSSFSFAPFCGLPFNINIKIINNNNSRVIIDYFKLLDQ